MGTTPIALSRLALLTVLLGACTGTPASTDPGSTTTTTHLSMRAPTTTRQAVAAEPGRIAPATPLSVPRAAHTATRLLDGRVLIVGGCSRAGCGGNEDAVQSELFDPATGAFTAGPPMSAPRAGHTATLLADGRVLVVGGYEGEGRPPLASTEIYDPATDRFTAAGAMAGPRGSHTATLLPDGRILVAGGTDGDVVLELVEIFDPATGRFTVVSPLPAARAAHAAVPVGAEVLLVGGHGADQEVVLSKTVRYDPALDAWSDAGDLRIARHKLAGVGLADGSALAVGGSDSTDDRGRLASIERWSPATATWTPVAEMGAARFKIENAVALLADGRVLIAGDGTAAEIYDPATHSLDTVPGLGTAAMFSTATVLDDGRVLVTGGYDDAIIPRAAAYVYAP